jgi:hypothetical protein
MSSGRFCKSPALNDDDFCYFHRAARERAKRQARHARQQKPLQLPLLEDREAIQLAIGDVLNALLNDRIDTKKAGLLLYGLQTAAGNARDLEFELTGFVTNRPEAYDNDEEETLELEIAEEIAEEVAVAEASETADEVPPKKQPAGATAPDPLRAAAGESLTPGPRRDPNVRPTTDSPRAKPSSRSGD